VDVASSRRIATWFSDEEAYMGACVYAQHLSTLTDWRQFDSLTVRQKRGLSVRLLEIRLCIKQQRVAALVPVPELSSSSRAFSANQPEVVQMVLF
jgi:hypothetical protein